MVVLGVVVVLNSRGENGEREKGEGEEEEWRMTGVVQGYFCNFIDIY